MPVPRVVFQPDTDLDINVTNTGHLSISSSAASSFVGLTWDGNEYSSSNSFTGLGGVDFAANGETGFEFFIVSNDAQFNLNLRAFPGDGGTGTLATATVPAGLSNTSYFVPFSSFSNPSVFGDVGQFDFNISGGPLNLQMDYVQTAVPESGSAIFILCFAGAI